MKTSIVKTLPIAQSKAGERELANACLALSAENGNTEFEIELNVHTEKDYSVPHYTDPWPLKVVIEYRVGPRFHSLESGKGAGLPEALAALVSITDSDRLRREAAAHIRDAKRLT